LEDLRTFLGILIGLIGSGLRRIALANGWIFEGVDSGLEVFGLEIGGE
jgi:hypothetical protein